MTSLLEVPGMLKHKISKIRCVCEHEWPAGLGMLFGATASHSSVLQLLWKKFFLPARGSLTTSLYGTRSRAVQKQGVPLPFQWCVQQKLPRAVGALQWEIMVRVCSHGVCVCLCEVGLLCSVGPRFDADHYVHLPFCSQHQRSSKCMTPSNWCATFPKLGDGIQFCLMKPRGMPNSRRTSTARVLIWGSAIRTLQTSWTWCLMTCASDASSTLMVWQKLLASWRRT